MGVEGEGRVGRQLGRWSRGREWRWRRGVDGRPSGIEGANAGLYIFVADDVPCDDELASVGEVDDTSRRELGGAEIDSHCAALGEMAVASTAGPGGCDTDKGTEGFEVCKGGRTLAKDIDGG